MNLPSQTEEPGPWVLGTTPESRRHFATLADPAAMAAMLCKLLIMQCCC